MATLTRKPVETEEERRRKFLSIPSPPLQPIESPATEPMGSVITRETEPLISVPSDPYVVYNNKAKPLYAEGGLSPLSRNQVLLEAQQNYKAPFSWKDLGLSALRGFIGGGLPGAAVGTADYGLNQNTRNRYAVGSDLERTQSAIETDLGRRRIDAQMAEQQARLEALTRQPQAEAEQKQEKDYQTTVENLRQLRGTTNPKEFEQLRRQEEVRLGRVIPLPAYEKQDQPARSDEFDLPPGGARYKRNADGTISVIAERPDRPQPSNVDEVGQRTAQLQAAQTRLQQAQTAAAEYQQQLQALDQSATNVLTYGPLTKVEGGVSRPVTDESGGTVYGDQKTPERIRYEQQREELQRKLDSALQEVKDANVVINSIYVPQPRGGSLQREDPKVRAYADQFFGGNYQAAEAEIKKQRGQ